MTKNEDILKVWCLMPFYIERQTRNLPITFFLYEYIQLRLLLCRSFTTSCNQMVEHFVQCKKIRGFGSSFPYTHNCQCLLFFNRYIFMCIDQRYSLFPCCICFLCIDCMQNWPPLVWLKTRWTSSFAKNVALECNKCEKNVVFKYNRKKIKILCSNTKKEVKFFIQIQYALHGLTGTY